MKTGQAGARPAGRQVSAAQTRPGKAWQLGGRQQAGGPSRQALLASRRQLRLRGGAAAAGRGLVVSLNLRGAAAGVGTGV